jgi:hypothetical protein
MARASQRVFPRFIDKPKACICRLIRFGGEAQIAEIDPLCNVHKGYIIGNSERWLTPKGNGNASQANAG